MIIEVIVQWPKTVGHETEWIIDGMWVVPNQLYGHHTQRNDCQMSKIVTYIKVKMKVKFPSQVKLLFLLYFAPSADASSLTPL